MRIGGNEDGYGVEVSNGKGVASLGTDPDGVPELTLIDAQNRPRGSMSADGTLEVADATGYTILSVIDDVAGEKAGVTIGGGKAGGIVRVADGAGKPAAGIIGSSRAVVVANPAGKTVAEMTAKTSGEGLVQVLTGDTPIAVLAQAESGGGIVQVTNGRVRLEPLASDAGAGGLQLNDGSGTPVVEAGVIATGRGVVRAGPKSHSAVRPPAWGWSRLHAQLRMGLVESRARGESRDRHSVSLSGAHVGLRLAVSNGTAQERAAPTRICLAPASIESTSGSANAAIDAARETFTTYLTGPTLEAKPLQARLASQVREEARQADCRYLLLTTLKHEHKRSGGGVEGGATDPTLTVLYRPHQRA